MLQLTLRLFEKALSVDLLEKILYVLYFPLAVFPSKPLTQKEQKKRKSKGKDTGM